MNATLRSAAKACLVTATTGLLCGQVAGLFAEDNRATDSHRSMNFAVQLAEATEDEEDDDAPVEQQTPAAETEVQKQLRAIYKKNGREMPSMNIADLPNTQVPSAPAGGGDQPGSTNAGSRAPKPNWFERTFHVGKGKRQAAPSARPVARPAAKTAAPVPAPAPAPTPAPTPGRSQISQPGARPGMPMYRPNPPAAQVYQNPPAPVPPVIHQPPIATVPTVSAVPAQPPYHEPAPLAPVVNPGERAVAATPPTVRPASPRGASQPLIDESGIKGDSESLELESNDAKPAARAPQMLASPSASGPAQSPYSGLKIAPNEIEQKADVALSAAPAVAAPAPAVPGIAPRETPSVAATVTPAPVPALQVAAPSAKAKDADLGLDDEGDKDDDETLSLPPAKPDALIRKPGEPERMVAGSDKPAAAPIPMKGLKGLCPVQLKDDRKLIDAQPGITSEYRGKTYYFSTVDAKKAFDENPKKYSPAGDGNDVVQLTSGEKKAIEGTLDHAAWYRGRLYLFASPESRLEFVETPSKFVIED
jgi:YHS domain-containing protein